MKTQFLMGCCLAFALMTALVADEPAADEILGRWLISTGEGQVEIYKKNGVYEGKVVWLREPTDPETNEPMKDKMNPNERERLKPLMGKQTLGGLKYRNGEWQDGWIYQPRTGKKFDCKVWLEGKDRLHLRAYWGLVYQTRVWTRAK